MLNLPNGLTILRILMTPAIAALILYKFRALALVLFCLAGLTDALDGFIARSRAQKTQLGMILDPLADKLLLTTSFVTLTYLREIPLWFAIVAVSRDLLLVIGALLVSLLSGKTGLPPSPLGKMTTGLQLLVVLVTMGDNFLPPVSHVLLPLFILTATVTVASGLDYIIRGSRLVGESA